MEPIILLYEQEDYANCILAINQYHLQNDGLSTTYLLLGKCNYQLANQNEEPAFYEKSFDHFSEAITLDHNLLEARLYRAYLGLYNLQNKLITVLEDSDFIIQNGNNESKAKAFQYQFEAAYTLKNHTLAIESLQQTKPLIQQFYKDNQPQRLKELALLELRMGDVFLNLKNDEAHAVSFYENGFNYYCFNTSFNHFFINILIRQKKYDMAAKVANSIFSALAMDGGYEQVPVILEQFGSWLTEGLKHRGIAKMYLRAMRNNSEIDQSAVLLEAKKLHNAYPNEYYFPFTIGSILFELKNYKEALPYLEKAMLLEYNPRVLAFLIQVNYKLFKKTIPLPKPPENTDPVEAYSAGVDIHSFIAMFETDSDKWRAAIGCQVYFYANAYAEFVRFFYSNNGTSAANHVHYFAMNCNNYGIALNSVGRHEEAIPIHKTGYALSPFWEQINSLSESEYKAGKYLDCLQTLQKIYTDYNDSVSMYHHLDYQLKMLRCYLQTQQTEQALNVINNIELEEPEIYAAAKLLDSAEAKFVLDSYNIILNEKSVLIQQMEGAESSIEALLKRLQTDPDNASVYYMLHQQYHIAGLYQKSVDCAVNYFQIKGTEKIDGVVLQNIFYRKGASFRHLKRYAESIESLTKAIDIDAEHYWSRHELALVYFETGDTLRFKEYGQWCIDQYVQNNFNWHAPIAEIAYALAEVYKGERNKKEIKKLTAFILDKDPGNTVAKLLKKEFGGWFS